MIDTALRLEVSMSQSRRAFFIGTSAAIGVSVLGARVRAQSLTKIRVGTIPIVDSAPLMIGIAKGFFRDEGLEVDTTPAPGGAALLPSLAAGQFNFAFANTTSALLAIGEGLEFKFVTAGCSTGAKGPDLVRAATWVDGTGGDADRVTFVEIPFPQMVDALVNNQVDAAMVNEPFLTVGLQNHNDKVKVVSWPMSDTAPNGVVSEYVATKDYIAQNPQVIEKFARAFAHGTDWVLENKGTTEWEQAVSAYTKIAPERLRGIALPVYDRVIEPRKIQDMIDLMHKYKILKADLKVADLIHPTALKQYKF
jgi:NitT/TauT family transport system substrate-binding protein